MSDTPIFDNTNQPKPSTFRSNNPVEPEPELEPSKAPQPKVVAATVGAGVGSALGEIVSWVVEATANIDIPANVELAIGVVLTAALAFLSGYYKKN